MKNLLRLFSAWSRESNGRMIGVSVASVIVIAIPFVALILLATSMIENENIYLPINAVIFLCYAVCYVSFVKYINKV